MEQFTAHCSSESSHSCGDRCLECMYDPQYYEIPRMALQVLNPVQLHSTPGVAHPRWGPQARSSAGEARGDRLAHCCVQASGPSLPGDEADDAVFLGLRQQRICRSSTAPQMPFLSITCPARGQQPQRSMFHLARRRHTAYSLPHPTLIARPTSTDPHLQTPRP